MVVIIDGQKLAEKIKDKVVREIVETQNFASLQNGPRPNLAIILVGNREDSELYVSLKEKEAKKVGIDTHLYKLTEKCAEAEILEVIDYLNNDNLIDAVLVQLPLPETINVDRIVKAIDPAKDVDGFHPDNLKILFATCDHEQVIPPIIRAVLEIFKSINFDLAGKEVAVLANSDIFGISMGKVLQCRGAKVSVVGPDDKNLTEKTSRADVLITAVGRPKFIKKEMIKKDAVIIDIGITQEGKRVCGDVDFENVKDVTGFITPVPGGVGPLTIAMALKNTLELWKNKYNKKTR